MTVRAHNGGGMPCEANALVVVKFRCGRLYGQLERDGAAYTPVEAGKLRWTAWREPAPFDIVAWRMDA